MRIVKEGVKRVFVKLFECPECHCVFEAERGEYTEKYEEYMGTEYHMTCPYCAQREQEDCPECEQLTANAGAQEGVRSGV